MKLPVAKLNNLSLWRTQLMGVGGGADDIGMPCCSIACAYAALAGKTDGLG